MAREVITRILCDVCMHLDEAYVEAVETPPITIGTAKPRILALCEVHHKEVFEPIKELLMDLGTVLSEGSPATTRFPGTSPGSGVFPCPVPDCHKHTKPFKHEQSLRNHSRNMHDMPIQQLRAQYAEGQGREGEDALFDPDATNDGPPKPKVLRAACDQPGCDKVYEWPDFTRPAIALGVHKSKAHGIIGAKHKPKAKAK